MASANYICINGIYYSPKHKVAKAYISGGLSSGNVSEVREPRNPRVAEGVKFAKRIRQSSKPLMNKLEQEWYDRHRDKYPNYPPILKQAVTLSLANGVKYTPDFFCFNWPFRVLVGGEWVAEPNGPTAWEIKGKHAWDDAIVKLKMAAHMYPEIYWFLCWKDNAGWASQRILP